MGVRIFIFLLLGIVTSLFVATIVLNPTKQIKSIKLPDVVFINSTMYDINTNEVSQLIKSKKANHFKNKDELYNATIVLKSQDQNEKKNLVSNSVSADFIEVTKKFFKFRGSVVYNKSTGTMLQSEALDYNRFKKQLTSNQKFVAFYNGNKLQGNSLSIDKDKNIFQSTDNTPLKLDIQMKQGKTK